MSTRLNKQFNGDGWMRIPGLGTIVGTSPTVPSDAALGYSVNSLYLDNDAASGAGWFINTGTVTSCAFKPLIPLAATQELVASGASLTIASTHHGRTILLAAAAAITLPSAAGTGLRVRFVVLITSTAVTITAAGAHLYGQINQSNDTAQGTGLQLPAISASPSTTITLDGTTKGGAIGDWIEIQDVATSKWAVRGQLTASGTEASPWS